MLVASLSYGWGRLLKGKAVRKYSVFGELKYPVFAIAETKIRVTALTETVPKLQMRVMP